MTWRRSFPPTAPTAATRLLGEGQSMWGTFQSNRRFLASMHTARRRPPLRGSISKDTQWGDFPVEAAIPRLDGFRKAPTAATRLLTEEAFSSLLNDLSLAMEPRSGGRRKSLTV